MHGAMFPVPRTSSSLYKDNFVYFLHSHINCKVLYIEQDCNHGLLPSLWKVWEQKSMFKIKEVCLLSWNVGDFPITKEVFIAD